VKRIVESGMTSVELLTAVVLLGLVTLAVYASLGLGTQSARDTNAALRTQSQIRMAVDRIVEEARWAARVAVPGLAALTLCIRTSPLKESPHFVWFSYDSVRRMITRAVDPDAGGPAPFSAPEPIAILPDEGSPPTFSLQYFTKAGTPTADPASIAQLQLRIRMRLPSTLRAPAFVRELVAYAALREFGYPCP
jgi:type II secretory pathway pseudopilin PulG